MKPKARHWGALATTVALIGAVILALHDGGTLDTNLPAPTGRESYRELLPVEIDGRFPLVRALPSGHGIVGAHADYGTAAAIDVVLAPAPADLDAFVRERLRPRLDAYEERAAGKFDGAWSLHGRGQSGRLYGWQNGRWLFVIEARSEAVFEEAVDRFAFIERR